MQDTRYKIDISDDGVWSISDESFSYFAERLESLETELPKNRTNAYNHILVLFYMFQYNNRYKSLYSIIPNPEYFFCSVFSKLKTSKKITNPEKFYNYARQWILEHEDHIKKLRKEDEDFVNIVSSSFARHLDEIIMKEEPTETPS